MYCTKCNCEFTGWLKECPSCENPLSTEKSPGPKDIEEPIDYDSLVDKVKENGGMIKADVSAVDVGMEQEFKLIYRGHGYGWVKTLRGKFDGMPIDLVTTEVGKHSEFGFPYFGFGYAWSKEIKGNIGGNEIILSSSKVHMEKEYRFPFRGYGFAWTEEMSGTCGSSLNVSLTITEAGKHKAWSFPYQGYGFAWESKGVLKFTLNESI